MKSNITVNVFNLISFRNGGVLRSRNKTVSFEFVHLRTAGRSELGSFRKILNLQNGLFKTAGAVSFTLSRRCHRIRCKLLF